MKRIESKTDLRRMVSDWIEQWNFEFYSVDYYEMVDELTDRIESEMHENNFKYGDKYDTELIDLVELSKDFEAGGC